MKLHLKIVGKNKQEILDVMEELLSEFSMSYVSSNSFTDHENGAKSDYDFTDGTTIEDDPKELDIHP